ncbi:glycosyltransferase [Kutzneria buriramensis]|uniref:UDP:flavonoid glycosyltransferase YjiC (YdhE family) n=1 Tax=Kutzneria buriramensis TaxID=1045776 RepID=A0A3E0HG85_9PSEU|nr:glycosyltransferase [Kutzneria buriramensis]REH43835.1 UDP:flavonoid glycosyltransferase YjiC (YdhE family) [Kutzneria buriramensis]
MAKVVITAVGSRGDTAPLIAIGTRLQDAGHDVTLSAMTIFEDLITGCGLRFVPHEVGTTTADLSAFEEIENPAKQLMEFMSPKGMRLAGENLLIALKDEPADVLLLSPFAELAGHPLAEARGIPSIGIRLQPMSTTGAFPPALMGTWSGGPAINRMAGRFGAGVIDRVYNNTVAHFRAQLGLPKVSARTLRRRRTEAGWPILHGFSPTVVPRPDDWRPGIDVTGYWWPPRPLNWEPPAELARFLDAGPPPMYIGFGSLPMPKAEAERVSALVALALHKAGVRGIVQAGWANLDVATDDVITIGEVPHDWLFDRVGAVAHACGAGTTGAGLRAGVPAVAIPYAGDQAFWARRLDMLGASAATVPFKKLTVDGLAAAITTAMTDADLRANAKAVAAKLAEEDGPGQVLRVVDRVTSTR